MWIRIAAISGAMIDLQSIIFFAIRYFDQGLFTRAYVFAEVLILDCIPHRMPIGYAFAVASDAEPDLNLRIDSFATSTLGILLFFVACFLFLISIKFLVIPKATPKYRFIVVIAVFSRIMSLVFQGQYGLFGELNMIGQVFWILGITTSIVFSTIYFGGLTKKETLLNGS